MANAHRGRLNDPDVPATAKDPSTWSELAQREWANPVAAAASHRAAMRTGMSRVRQALDDFDPDLVLIWGDEQYENVRGERGDTERLLRGHPEAAKYLATKLLEAEFDTAYAWSEGGKRGRGVAASIGIMLATYRQAHE
jgi:hypothetical protein